MTPQISRNILWPLPFCSIRTQTQKTRSKFEKIRPPEWDTKKKSKSLLSLLSWQCQSSNFHYFPKLKKLNPPLSVLWMSLSFHALCDLAASPVLLSRAPSCPASPSAGSALQKPPCAERTPVLLGEKPTLCISRPLQDFQSDLVCHSHSKAVFLPAVQFLSSGKIQSIASRQY